jgi:predicted Fe-Mo cluster-binding NifX family protein
MDLDRTNRLCHHHRSRATAPTRIVSALAVRQLGVNTVVAGGIGQRAIELFTRHNVAVRAGEPGTRVEIIAAAFLSGQLERAPEACAHHGHHHDHEHDHPHAHVSTPSPAV